MAVIVTLEGRVFHAVFSDPFTYEDFFAACTKAIESPEFAPPMKPLIEMRQVKRSVPWNEIRDMVDFSFTQKDKFARRCAIVCEPGSLVYGLVRMFCALAEYYGLEYTLFADCDEARQWVSQSRSQIPT
jgi:hypothetical protein